MEKVEEKGRAETAGDVGKWVTCRETAPREREKEKGSDMGCGEEQ